MFSFNLFSTYIEAMLGRGDRAGLRDPGVEFEFELIFGWHIHFRDISNLSFSLTRFQRNLSQVNQSTLCAYVERVRRPRTTTEAIFSD